MTDREFLALVAELRRAQKEFFRTRSTAALDWSKRLETRVDNAVRKAMDGQRTFFDEGEE